MTKKVKHSLGARIIRGLTDAADKLERGEPLTFRTVVMQLEPSPYDARKIAATRDLLAVSQSMFAKFLGVSPAAVRAWEQGAKAPSDIARRFMDEIRRNPEYWQQRMRESIKVKTAQR